MVHCGRFDRTSVWNLLSSWDFTNSSVTKLEEAVTQSRGLVAVVRDVQYGNRHLLSDGTKQVVHFVASVVVERTERFVEEQNVRVHGDGAPQSYAPRLATAEPSGSTVQQLPDPQQLGQCVDTDLDGRAAPSPYDQCERQVFSYGERGEKATSCGT